MATLKEKATAVGTTAKAKVAQVGAEAQKARNTKSTRLWFIGLIGAIVFVLWYFKIIKTGFAVGLGIILLAAFGIEAYDYDLDLGKLWETGNIQESRVESFKDDQ
jgi:O-antigen ligase